MVESGLLDSVRPSERREFAAHLGEIWSRWRNSYRYQDVLTVRADLHARGLTKGISGSAVEQVKANCHTAMEHALIVITHGVRRWNALD